MQAVRELETARLRLRRWRAEDREPFARLNDDPRVMEFLGDRLTHEQSDAMADRIEAGFARHGFGLWAVEVKGGEPFIGFVGLSVPRFEAQFTPCVEVGWRLAFASWGHGYAREAAYAAMRHGFEELEMPEIVSFTTAANLRSRRVMERLGMRHRDSDDFEHPALPDEHPLRPHVLYRLTRVEWIARRELARNPVRFA